VILYRCFAWNRRAAAGEPDAPLTAPRAFQGDGRHDNPSAYGCLYLTDAPVSGLVEQLAPWRGQRLLATMLVRRGLPLALAAVELDDAAEVVDLDRPRTLVAERLRPSLVATRDRSVTQPQALRLHAKHDRAAALRWWSTYGAAWANYTVFDRALPSLRVVDVHELTAASPEVAQAADLLGMMLP
jgi:hypothetical protein